MIYTNRQVGLATKVCSRCKLEKDTSLFYVDISKKDRLSTLCIKCKKNYYITHLEKEKSYSKNYYKENLEKVKEKLKVIRLESPEKPREVRKRWNLKNMHNLSITIFNKMLEEQEGVCAICGKTQIGDRALCVDHDHATGKIRALLCTKCNAGLGNFNDDTVLLSKAIDYLNKHTLGE